MSKPPLAPKPAPKPRNIKVSRAAYDYQAEEEDELSFTAGDVLYIVDSSDPDWWRARCKGKEGMIPSNMVELAGDSGTSPLHDAAKRGNLEMVRECLSNRMPVNQADPAGNTALHWAARSGQLDCLQELLSVAQIGVDKINKLGDTALMLAANHGHAHCVEALLKAKADTNKTNNEGKTVVDLAKDDDVVIMLKCFNVIKTVRNEFGDEEYNQDDDEDD